MSTDFVPVPPSRATVPVAEVRDGPQVLREELSSDATMIQPEILFFARCDKDAAASADSPLCPRYLHGSNWDAPSATQLHLDPSLDPRAAIVRVWDT
jgi:hypothetical protein